MKLIPSYNDKQLDKYRKSVEVINSLEAELKNKSDEYFKQRTLELKKEISEGKSLNDILEEAFALVREASVRVLGMRHFDVQLMGGMALHYGNICEMKTGEGKTLVATLSAYLNALDGKGVHVITVNDYLAKRDATQMKPLFEFLGLTCNYIVSQSSGVEKKNAYNGDITYITNSELGFDYLRDNMVLETVQKMQRPLNYCIIDEADSILIDEARVPLIISGPAKSKRMLYIKSQKFVETLTTGDYEVDYKMNTVDLTESGVKKAEEFYKMTNYSDEAYEEDRHAIKQSLLANMLFDRDVKYVVAKNEVVLIDAFTGRISKGRRYNNGLHQALEAKEGVPIQPESETWATVTYQNFFRMYNKVSGMTGTAATEANELREIYNLPVIVIPTNKPMIRDDRPDRIYLTAKDRDNDVIKYIQEIHKTGQPILVGTNSVEKSELFSKRLSELLIKHQVLNAKYHEKEAEIVAKAGQKGAITISTNMAGRGTDIKLGEGVAELGGLFILGSERHENRRIDNQLRGRAGRQGDAGVSQFFVSLDDEIFKMTGLDKTKVLMKQLVTQEGGAVENKTLSGLVKNTQLQLESRYYDARKNTLRADSLLTKQREQIYMDRDEVLQCDHMNDVIKEFIKIVFTEVYKDICEPYHKKNFQDNLKEFIDNLNETYFTRLDYEDYKDIKRNSRKPYEILQKIVDDAIEYLDKKHENIGKTVLNMVEQNFTVQTVDKYWRMHLDNMEDAKVRSQFASFSGGNPYIVYNEEGYQLYNDMIFNIRSEIVANAFSVKIKISHGPRVNIQETKALKM